MNPKCPVCPSYRNGFHRVWRYPEKALMESGLPEEKWFSKAYQCMDCKLIYSEEYDEKWREYRIIKHGRFEGNELPEAKNWRPAS